VSLTSIDIPPRALPPLGYQSFAAFPAPAIVQANSALCLAVLNGAGLFPFDVLITDAQMKALSVTPITLLPAPGAGFALWLIISGWQGQITVNGGVGMNGTIRYNAGSPANRVAAAAATMVAVANGNRNANNSASTFNTQVAGDTVENAGLEIVGSAVLGGTFATTSGFRVYGMALRSRVAV